ncbi:hypothetical protein GHK92_07570 [Nocardioides sp. dk4132]|uniref:DUF6912 family protein n=1 Tax=unclassified Nocardioides TaxID=2615069 RepID=UPI0012967504|nr:MULTISPECIES: hypothetical protein [unclassified Nocardioides]MQW75727.1 hypothetical protein [Nocardioides sp. dk4132]QGA08613.1 hypothetical protein GFH29_15320 [Nocardioides sp. dk884]
MSTRVYVPTTLEGLAAHVAAGEVPAGEDRFVAPDETEEGEYAALTEAALASAELLGAPGRRVVLVAEVADPDAAVPLRDLVAVHVDIDAEPDPDDDLAWFATQEIPQLLDGSAF